MLRPCGLGVVGGSWDVYFLWYIKGIPSRFGNSAGIASGIPKALSGGFRGYTGVIQGSYRDYRLGFGVQGFGALSAGTLFAGSLAFFPQGWPRVVPFARVLLTEEILHHVGSLKHCNFQNLVYSGWWRRLPSINSISKLMKANVVQPMILGMLQ